MTILFVRMFRLQKLCGRARPASQRGLARPAAPREGEKAIFFIQQLGRGDLLS
jgi:hypothetical protein